MLDGAEPSGATRGIGVLRLLDDYETLKRRQGSPGSGRGARR